MKLITCERCGKRELRHESARFCFECAKERNKENMRQAYHANKLGCKAKPDKHCKVCGCIIAHNRQYCDKCRAERYRTYQREYKRCMRAKK